jgi:hypothetical protein
VPSNRNYAVVPQGSSVAGQPANVLPINTKAINAAVLPMTFPCTAAAEAVITNPAVASSALILAVPSKSIMEGMPFDLLISGVINQLTAAATIGFSLYMGNSLTPGSNTLMRTVTPVAYTGIAPFYIKATLQGDSVSGKMVGTVKSLINLTLGAEAAIAAALAVPLWATDPVVQFVLSVTPSAANAGNYVKLYEFAANF